MPLGEKKIEVHNFHIVGGGCFGCQYARWLLRAKELGRLDFQKIYIIDHDPNSQINLKAEFFESKKNKCIEVVFQDWVEYLAELLIKFSAGQIQSNDHWVPSPLSPHIFLLGFKKAVERLSNIHIDIHPFRENTLTPFQMALDSGSYAVSFAEWTCPVNCIEPARCPAIRAPRHWDMKKALEKYFLGIKKQRAFYVFQCQHLVHGVGTIPLREVFQNFQGLLSNLKSPLWQELVVATVSRCHGLIGCAKIRH